MYAPFADESWSEIGTDATKSKDKTTMKLCLKPADYLPKPHHYIKYTVLHETGHALGFKHEHQCPTQGNGLDRKKIISYLTSLYGISKDRADRAESRYERDYKPADVSTTHDLLEFPFDKDSVMIYWYVMDNSITMCI